MNNERVVGATLVAAAVLFWTSWALMPGVGITDAARILELVAAQRSAVLASAILQTISAALYVPAILGIAVHPRYGSSRTVIVGCGIFLCGVMGSAADAVYHLLAFAMTAPGLDPKAQLPVMQFMQGPGLRLILPLVAAYFIGPYVILRTLGQRGLVPRGIAAVYLIAIAVAIGGALVAARTTLTGRTVGLAVLLIVSFAQAWLGFAILTKRP